MSVKSSELYYIICGKQTLKENNPQKFAISTMTYYNFLPELIFLTFENQEQRKMLDFYLERGQP